MKLGVNPFRVGKNSQKMSVTELRVECNGITSEICLFILVYKTENSLEKHAEYHVYACSMTEKLLPTKKDNNTTHNKNIIKLIMIINI